jgi:hypothetical protein
MGSGVGAALKLLSGARAAPKHWWSELLLCAKHAQILVSPKYTVPKAMDDFIVNNEKKKHSSYGMKSFISFHY